MREEIARLRFERYKVQAQLELLRNGRTWAGNGWSSDVLVAEGIPMERSREGWVEARP